MQQPIKPVTFAPTLTVHTQQSVCNSSVCTWDSKQWFMTSCLRKLMANSQVFHWCLNSSKFVTDNSNSITALTAFDSTKKTKIIRTEMELKFFTHGGQDWQLHGCFKEMQLPVLWSCQYPNISKGTDGVGGWMHVGKECPCTGVTNYGGVGRKGVGKPGLECALRWFTAPCRLCWPCSKCRSWILISTALATSWYL